MICADGFFAVAHSCDVVTARYSEGSFFRRFPTLELVGLVRLVLGNLRNIDP